MASRSIKGTSLFLLVAFLLPLNFCVQADLIDETCKKTQYPDLCISTLRSNPLSPTADVNGLVRYVLQAALNNATGTLNSVNFLFKNTTDENLKQRFNVCISEYQIVLQNIPAAIQNVGSNKDAATTYASSAIAEAKTCEDAFTNGPYKSPLTANNNLVMQLDDIAIEILKSTA